MPPCCCCSAPAWSRLCEHREHRPPWAAASGEYLSVAIHGLRRKMLDTGYQIVTVPNEGLILRYRDYVGRALKTGT